MKYKKPPIHCFACNSILHKKDIKNKMSKNRSYCFNCLIEICKEAENANKRLRATLDYIALLANIKNPHLGRPRLSDKKCIFCMAYFALNNGAFGDSISTKDYKKWAVELRKSIEKGGK